MGIIARIKGEEPGIIAKIPHALQGKGHYGEYLIGYALEHAGFGDVAVFSNVLVPRATGPTAMSEIDAVMLHEKGVFVFESKNYSGWIFGSADQRNWTVTFNANSKKQFYNPIKQNRAHVKALSDYLDLETEAFSSYIVFSDRCEFKGIPANTSEYVICHRRNLLRHLRKDLGLFDPIFNPEVFSELKAKLVILANNSTQEARAEHLLQAKEVAYGLVCPRCGSELVKRNGKFGPFIGCSAYPKCRFTRDI